MMKKACFFIQTDRPEIIEYVEFYRIDIQILQDLGFEVVPCFSFKKIPKDVDFYFIWWWTYAIFPILMAKLLRKKTMITGTFDLATPIKGKGFYLRPFHQRFLLKKSAQFSDANVVVSMYEQERMEKEITKGNVFYSPHALHFGKYLESNNDQRQKYVFTISWMSNLNARRKCIPEIIKAAHLLKKQNQQIKFYIAGKMEADALFLKEMVEEFELNDLVIFLGRISEEEKIKRLNECSIYLQPSMFEGFGLAIAEAMLCGAPILTSKVGAVSEVTNDYCTYVNGKNSQEIANKILTIFENYDYHLRIAHLGEEHVKLNFRYERRLNDFKKLFQLLGLSN